MFRRVSTVLLIVVLLPVVYVGSYGPLCWAFRRDWFDRVTFNRVEEFYLPLSRWMWNGEGPLNDWYWRWHKLWDYD